MKKRDKEMLTGIGLMLGSGFIKDKRSAAECFFKGLAIVAKIELPQEPTISKSKKLGDEIIDIDYEEIKDSKL